MTHSFASVYKSENPDLFACRNRLRTYLIARFQAKTESKSANVVLAIYPQDRVDRVCKPLAALAWSQV